MKQLKYAYITGFILLTLFGLYYYTQALKPVDIKATSEKATSESNQESVSRSFNISGMYCESCKHTIEKEVGKIVGVLSVDVNQKTKEMVVVYNQKQERIKETLEAVKALGYTAGLKSSDGKLQVVDFNIKFQ